MIGESGASDDKAAHVGRATVARDGEVEEAGMAKLGDQRPAFLVDIASLREVARAAPLAEPPGEIAMGWLEERPVEPVSHP